VFAGFNAERADFLRRVLASGKTGRTWTTVDPEASAEALGEERDRIVAALGYLEQQGLVELKATDVRQRYTLRAQPPSLGALGDALAERFERREQAEAERIARVVSLVTHDGCQVQALVGYFGEKRTEPCGHCTYCLTGAAQRLPEHDDPPAIAFDEVALDALAEEHPGALATPRQRARFLCGLTSPATTRAKLSRHPLFATLAEERFADVLSLCESGAVVQSR
jgi:ATP-dependent DNA helicase RecQ